jgi:hypothetical protein
MGMVKRSVTMLEEDCEKLEDELRAWRERFPSLVYGEHMRELYFDHEWGRDDMGRCTKCGER